MDTTVLFRLKDIPFDINDPDGLMYMLDHDFGGCVVFAFSNLIDETRTGKVFVDGKEWRYILKKDTNLAAAFHKEAIYLLGVKLSGYIIEYGQKAIVCAEGFYDINGSPVQKTEFVVAAKEDKAPEKKYENHDAIALQAAQEGIVLLKNENNVLPLTSDAVLNIFGGAFHSFRNSAVGAGKINARCIKNLRESILKFSDFSLNKELDEFYKDLSNLIPSEEMLLRAKEKNDLGIVVISRASGENIDNTAEKGSFYLTDDEEKLIEKVSKVFSQTVVIVNSGYPIDVRFAEKYQVDGLIYCGFCGMFGGKALVQILDGRVNPSGKLPDTWAKDLSDIPADKNFFKISRYNVLDGNANVWIDSVYEEGIYVGYRYFATFGVKPAYPFGYGLSYTKFSIRCQSFSYDGKSVKLTVTVKNIGQKAGKCVVQFYVSKPDTTVEKPKIELVEFEKTTELQCGEEQTLNIDIPNRFLTYYDEKKAAYVLDNGEYVLYLGEDSQTLCKIGGFFIEEALVDKQVKNRMLPVYRINELSKYEPENSYPKGKKTGIKEDVIAIEPKAKREFVLVRCQTSEKISAIADNMTKEQLARFVICSSDGWGMENIGGAGVVYPVDGLNIPEYVVADGNSGVNIQKPNIGFPSGVSICASFNKDLAEEIGRVIGEEADENDIKLILAPGMNIHRHPLCGRQPEYFSEDPYLAGKMAGYYVCGLEKTGVASCIKHCLANNTETARKRNQSIMSERTLREIYFKPFEIAMSICQPTSMMTSYNALNGCATSADPEMINGLFREECGFNGFVMTDWGTYDTVNVVDMLKAGNNWIAPGSNDDTFTKLVLQGLREGELDENVLRESAKFILNAVLK